MSVGICITGMGMVTPVGFSARQTCAALRAGVARFREMKELVDSQGEPVVAARTDPADPDLSDAWSMTSMAIMACEEALWGFSKEYTEGRPIGLSVLVKEDQRPGTCLETLTPAILSSSIGHAEKVTVSWYRYGNASGMRALADAQRRLAEDPWRIELLLGADSLSDPATLRYLEAMGRLKAPTRPRGVIPGEAVVCLAIESLRAVRDHSTKPYCTIEGVGEAVENSPVGADSPCLGTGLTSAIQSALHAAQWTGPQVERVYCDLNGEEYRAHEWMLALCRTLASPEVVHPADCIGDVGSAFCPLLIGMAGMAFRRSYGGTDRALVFCSSDYGLRGAVCLSAIS